MKCPFCGHLEDRVIESRVLSQADAIRRRRECEACEKRFTTYERVEYALPMVEKKDGRREPFERKKLTHSLAIACNKRPVSTQRIEDIADGIERDLGLRDGREITSRELGEKIMTALSAVDQVAYVRFASVYRSFRDASEFAQELERLNALLPKGDVAPAHDHRLRPDDERPQ